MSDNQMIATANSVKDRIRRRANAESFSPPTPSVRGAMVGTLNRYLGGDEMRAICLSWLFTGDDAVIQPLSSKELTDSQVYALVEWIDWWKDEEETWHVGEFFPHEAISVLNASLQAYNMADRNQKMGELEDSTFSLVAAMTDMGGVVTNVTEAVEELEKQMSDLSSFDKSGGEQDDD